MENTKFDITSTAIEKGIDLIAGFIEKLAGSSLEEAGLLLSDKIRTRRLRNQIKIFSDAKRIAEENNLSIKHINLKTLIPLLEFSSLEEDETLQKKWSNLIVKFSDANQHYESSIFPFILNQLSASEAIELDRIQLKKGIRSTSFRISEIQISNLKRLGLIDRIINEGFMFSEEENSPVYYSVTEIGIQFINCCSSIK
ncbi:Abi-alpha family protein [Flavobacterium hibernum]|uniref:DUF4393 domain-containing protein n=1 Tax=Flavobacterium hibernum TaxID=37752 RepID=A0ABX4BZY2_9FLAO|nr:Abi-alpha family protein [Flavobacterium hibernum]OXA85210.1 hypothetical protein B0A73_17835 [Flavobacterium hibernum]STO11338.1 Uncharacterised protein [Flavobacterium hibernum]